jgi:hypothetical protein
MTVTQSGFLVIYLKDGAAYLWPHCTKIRSASRELRWTNARNEHRSMAHAFIDHWHITEESTMAATFHLTDGTTIDGVTLYSKVNTHFISDPARRVEFTRTPHYTVFSPAGHRYVPVNDVTRIDEEPTFRARTWYDLPIAGGMWAADGADLKV